MLAIPSLLNRDIVLRMGFDQYHEPPHELPAETRTFALICASLTEGVE